MHAFGHRRTVILLDLLCLGVLLHVLQALGRAELEAAAVVHVPHGLQQNAHFRDPGVNGEGHGTSVI